MNDVEDLTRVLRDLERHAPELTEVQARLARDLAAPTPRNVTRWIVPLAAAAAVVVTAVAVTALPGSSTGARRPVGAVSSAEKGAPPPLGSGQASGDIAARERAEIAAAEAAEARARAAASRSATVSGGGTVDFTWRFAVRPVAGYTITRESITAADQTARVTVTGANKDMGGIDVYTGAGAQPRDLATMSGRTTVSVNGRTGYLGVSGLESVLLWHYSGAVWAEVSGDWGYVASATTGGKGRVDLATARPEILSIARAVEPAHDALTLDFRVGWLPAGLVPTSNVFYADFGGGPLCEVDLTDDIAGVPSPDVPAPAVTITRSVFSPSTQPGSQFVPNLTVRGDSAQYTASAAGRTLLVRYAYGTELVINVDANHVSRYTKADLVKIARLVTPVGQPSRISTWLPASTALPQ